MGSQARIEQLGPEDTPPKAKDEKKASSSRARSSSTRATKQQETTLRERLEACFDRIADSLESRGDDELAGIVRDDAAVMSAGLVSLTRPFKPIRTVVLAFVALLEPVLAFGRLLRVIAGRVIQRRAEEAQRAAAEAPEPDASVVNR